VNTKVEQLEKSIRAIDESIEVIKKLGGAGGDTSGIIDMINDLKTQLKFDTERLVDEKIGDMNKRIT
jgi:hypothetical protein